MKFGYIDFNRTVNWYWNNSWNKKALLNIGDASEYKVVKQLYKKLGISDDIMMPLCIHDLISYRGEKLIVALNIALDSYVGYNDIIEELSPDIVPVFLGMSFTEMSLTEKQIDCLKRYAPIGCRDQRSYELIKSHNIECYLNGCTASCIDLPENIKTATKGKILFIDVPASVARYVPDSIKKRVKFISQELYCKRSDLSSEFIPSKWAEEVFSEYSDNIDFIVTSRFHGAVLALAQNIPAIVTLERMTFRFSWIGQHLPIYTEDNYDEINWTPSSIDYTPTKKLIETIALKRISDTVEKFGNLLKITDIQRCSILKTEGSTNQTLYYQRTWNTIKKTWNKDASIRYAFWGINENAEHLFQLISQDFPNAKLVEVYDMFKCIQFKNIQSVHPRNITKYLRDENFYIIVTAYLAARVADDICEDIGFSSSRILKCERLFVNSDDLIL